MARAKKKKPSMRLAWSDSAGQFSRWLGKRNDGVDLVPHKFYLGSDKRQATRAVLRLEELWKLVQTNLHQDLIDGVAWSDEPAWEPDTTLLMARAIAKGQHSIVIPTNPDLDDEQEQAEWLSRLAARYPIISLEPANKLQHQAAIDRAVAKAKRLRGAADAVEKSIYTPTAQQGQTFHQAIEAFAKHIKATKKTAEGLTTQHGERQAASIRRLAQHHADIPLDRFSLSEVEDVVTYWGNRPKSRKGRPMAVKTCVNHLTTFKAFIRWLHKSERFAWRKPEDLDFAELKPRIPLTAEERDAKLSAEQVDTYSVEELVDLYRYATPLQRAILVLGLNCAFANAEISSLTLKQIRLRQPHKQAKVLGIDSTAADSFIGRFRGKTTVFAEWRLWPETVAAIEWAILRRDRILAKLPATAVVPDNLILSELGKPFDCVTKGNNHSAKVGNLWSKLTKAIQADVPSFRKISFKHIRKTSGNFIRMIAGGEVMRVHMSRGKVVSDDLADRYTNRPFGEVFKALDALREQLNPMFSAVADPFPAVVKKGGPNLSLAKREQIAELVAAGIPVDTIAKTAGVHRSTVYRRKPR